MKKPLDLSKLELVDELDEEELEIHNALLSGKAKSIDSPETRKYYAEIFKESNRRSRAISLRLQERDYLDIRARAAELGLPYQSLINSIIHRYLTGELKATF